jgi:hypothetical protein
MARTERKINIHAGFRNAPMRQVACPECGGVGASTYPCYCCNCRTRGNQEVMMLPSSNGRIISNWCEVDRQC